MKTTKLDPENGFYAVRGMILNPLSDTRCDCYADGLLVAKKVNHRWQVEELSDAEELCSVHGWDLDAIPVSEGLILPPFYDPHFHWVQDDVRDMPKVSLLEWLERYTFPEEARFAEKDYAVAKAKRFWGRIHSFGTVGGLAYSSIHSTALDAAMAYAPEGFRIGGSLMTMNCPDFLKQSIEDAIAEVSYGVQKYGKRYCITPRFAPTTHPDVMSAAARLANEAELFQQTHMDETKAEIEWVLGIYSELEGFEKAETYAEIYQRCGVLGPRTVLGHAIHLEDSELDLLAASDTAIASCPTSNAPVEELGLGSGLFNFEQVERRGIRWALASDIGGGPFLSMFDVMQSFVQQNRDMGVPGATFTKALYRSTVAGAGICGYEGRRGNFTPGHRFDYIRCAAPTLPKVCDAEKALALIIDQAPSREALSDLILETVVNGETVYERTALQA